MKLSKTIFATLGLSLSTLTGCMASGTWSVTPAEGSYCQIPDADQINIVYQNPYVPNYLMVSINNGQFVFDECAPDSSQGDFSVSRGSGTLVSIGLHDNSDLRNFYFSGYSPMRSDLNVKIYGRQSCYQSPITIVPTTSALISWAATTASGGTCSVDGYSGTAVIN